MGKRTPDQRMAPARSATPTTLTTPTTSASATQKATPVDAHPRPRSLAETQKHNKEGRAGWGPTTPRHTMITTRSHKRCARGQDQHTFSGEYLSSRAFMSNENSPERKEMKDHVQGIHSLDCTARGAHPDRCFHAGVDGLFRLCRRPNHQPSSPDHYAEHGNTKPRW